MSESTAEVTHADSEPLTGDALALAWADDVAPCECYGMRTGDGRHVPECPWAGRTL